jgi:hypothetical protein
MAGAERRKKRMAIRSTDGAALASAPSVVASMEWFAGLFPLIQCFINLDCEEKNWSEKSADQTK